MNTNDKAVKERFCSTCAFVDVDIDHYTCYGCFDSKDRPNWMSPIIKFKIVGYEQDNKNS